MIYLDNAATSWPKPPAVLEAMTKFMNEIGANPGRSGHSLSIEAGKVVFKARENVARLFNISRLQRIVFTKNITEALNYVLLTMLQAGDHVITTSMEHNSVMRPLRHLEKKGVELTVVDADTEGSCNAFDISEAIKQNTRMVVVNHGSNVTGTIQDIQAIGEICKDKKVLMVVDSAQTAGVIPIDVEKMNIDILCFTGHKGLFGPMGTGGVYLSDTINPVPLLYGGTGSLSDLEEQPNFLPDIWESGTMNTVGIAGLGAGIGFILDTGLETIRNHEKRLTRFFIDQLKDVENITLFGPSDENRKTAVASINIRELVCSDIGQALDQAFGIMVRTGLHCAPAAHKTIKTFPTGTVRFSFSYLTTMEELKQATDAICYIANSVRA